MNSTSAAAASPSFASVRAFAATGKQDVSKIRKVRKTPNPTLRKETLAKRYRFLFEPCHRKHDQPANAVRREALAGFPDKRLGNLVAACRVRCFVSLHPLVNNEVFVIGSGRLFYFGPGRIAHDPVEFLLRQ